MKVESSEAHPWESKKGIYQSIGLNELAPYFSTLKNLKFKDEPRLSSLNPEQALSPPHIQTSGKCSQSNEDILSNCIKKFRAHHRSNFISFIFLNLTIIKFRRYSRTQETYIRNRLLRRSSPVFCMNTSDLSSWHNEVLLPSEKICKGIIRCAESFFSFHRHA
jgi:hypothetical protein